MHKGEPRNRENGSWLGCGFLRAFNGKIFQRGSSKTIDGGYLETYYMLST